MIFVGIELPDDPTSIRDINCAQLVLLNLFSPEKLVPWREALISTVMERHITLGDFDFGAAYCKGYPEKEIIKNIYFLDTTIARALGRWVRDDFEQEHSPKDFSKTSDADAIFIAGESSTKEKEEEEEEDFKMSTKSVYSFVHKERHKR